MCVASGHTHDEEKTSLVAQLWSGWGGSSNDGPGVSVHSQERAEESSPMDN